MGNNKMHCCEKCQIFWTCETKWYRGERGEENICCPVCNFYRECLKKFKANESKNAKKVKAVKK